MMCHTSQSKTHRGKIVVKSCPNDHDPKCSGSKVENWKLFLFVRYQGHPKRPTLTYLRSFTGKLALVKSHYEKAQKQFSLWTLPLKILLEYHAMRFKEHHQSGSRLGHLLRNLYETFRISRIHLNLDSETIPFDRGLKGQHYCR